MGAATKPVTDATFEAEVLQSAQPVLVDFWAEWCGPCKMVGPVLEELAGEMQGQVVIAKMDVDNNPMTPSKYGIRSIPTLMMFKGGNLVATKVGALPKTALQAWIKEHA
ncbi:MAG: thioredoxin [Alphaproteobacteria bacterium]|nr:thioredoxin [Alphaproteobacteria bacterium]